MALADEWTTTELLLVCAFAIGVLMFVVLFAALLCTVRNAIIAVRRLRSCTQTAAWLLLVLYTLLLYFELVEQRRVEWPHLGVVRPIVCLALGCFYFFTTTHPFFRWLTLAVSGTTVVCNTLASATLRIIILCRANNTCTNRSEHSVLMLEMQWVRNLADIVVAIVLFMLTVAMSVTMGWCRSNLPPRLFDASVPMSFVPETSGGNPQLLQGYSAAAQRGLAAYARNEEIARGQKLTSSRPGLERDSDDGDSAHGVGTQNASATIAPTGDAPELGMGSAAPLLADDGAGVGGVRARRVRTVDDGADRAAS